ncbi:MAG: acyl--CoA ligase [Planctomycetia bacterium]|nr:acyl--CoA ligase [Planctomycetia bacterium]
MHGPLTEAAGAVPILAAANGYRGTVVDLDAGVSVQGSELADAIHALAEFLVRSGLYPGDRLVLSLSNGPHFITALCGALAAGAAPLVVHSDAPPEELRRFAQNVAARFILGPAAHAESLSGIALRRTSFEFAGWLECTLTELPCDAVVDTFPKLPGVPLHPTSGTTGRPKVAARPADRAVAEARHYIDTMTITPDDTVLCAVPMSHAYGYGMGCMVPLLSGAQLVTTRQFNPRSIQKALANHRVTIFPAVPAMLDLVLRAGDGCTRPRLVLAAGAPLSEATATQFREQAGVRVTPLYGTTETGGISVAINELGDLPTGCVGRPMEGVETAIRPLEDSPELAEGVGRLMIRSSSMMSGYLTPEGIDNSSIEDSATGGGWFETGDLAHLDPLGRIHLVGREKEMINVFGMKVVPSEVEEVIATLPGIREVKVYACAHRSGSEIVKVAVAANREMPVATIRSHCEAHLAPYKRPQVIHLVDALPRSTVGKIIREQLP